MTDTKQSHRSSPELLTPAAAAVEVCVTARTIRQWIALGRLPAFRTDPGRGGRLLVRRADLLALLQPVTAGGGA
jgi:excisionase family DNA binding protein